MSEPVGWNVYYGSTFGEFIPNEESLAREAGRLAGDVEQYVGRAGTEAGAASIWDGFFGTFLRAAEEACLPAPVVDVPAGTLTLAQFEKWLDELWAQGRWPSAREADDYAARAVMPPDPFCGAALFAPDDGLRGALRREFIARGIAVDPFTAGYLNSPVQGPPPLRCERESHPEGTWHREGRTWWK